MPGALVNNSGSTFTSGPVASPVTFAALSWTPAVGNTLYVGIRLSGNASATQPSVSDNINGSYTALGTWVLDGGAATSHGEVFKRTVVTATAPAITFSWTGGNAGYTVVVWEVSGTTGEVVASGSGNSATPIGGSVSPSGAGIIFLFTETATSAMTFTSALDNSGGNAMTIDAPPSGTFRASLSHRAGEAAGTYVPQINQSTEGWVAVTVFALDSATGSSNVGRVGLRGTNDATVTHTTSEVGRVGLRGTNTKLVVGIDIVGRVGIRGTNSASVIHTTSEVGRVGLRGADDATVTHTTSEVGRVGLRSTNTQAGPNTATLGRVGLRSTNVSSKTVQDFVVGGVGVRGTNAQPTVGSTVVGRVGLRGTNQVGQQASNVVGRVGLRSTNVSTRSITVANACRVGLRGTNSVAPPLGSSQGHVGVRGTNASNSVHTTDAVGRVGFRCTNSFTHSSVTPTNVGRVGVRSVCTSTRFVTSTSVGRSGLRGVNVWVEGIPPTPDAPPVVNASDCEPDWNLAKVVVWA